MKVLSFLKSVAGRRFHRPNFPERKIRAAAAAGLLLLWTALLAAQDDYIPAETVRPSAGLHPVGKTVFPNNTVFYELSNGLSLFVQKTDSNLATVRAYIKNTGSANEGEFLGSGISHLTEHIVCAGSTDRRKEDETLHLLERLGGSFNAATGKEMTSYYIDCSAETVPAAMDLLADWITRCAVDQDEFAREKQVIARELADAEEDPARAEADLLIRTIYRIHPYRHPVGGYPGAFADLTREDVKKFYDTRYTPNNTVFLVAGNVSEEEVLRRLISLYQDIPRGRETEQALSLEPPQIAPREAGREMEGKMFRLLLAWPTTKLEEPDTCPLDVLATLLAGGASGRLHRQLKEEKQVGFLYDAQSLTPSAVPGFFSIRAETRPEELEPVRTAVLDLIREISEAGVSEEELTRAKKITEAAFLRGRETLTASADACVMNYIMTGNPNFDETYLSAVRRVSPADITRVVRTYFKPEKLNTVIVAPPGMSPKTVISSDTHSASAIAGFNTQENGLRLLVKQDSNLPLVTVQVCALGGSLAETESAAGTCALLADMLARGTETHSKTEIENYFDLIGGEFGFYAGRNTLVGEMTVLKGDFKEAFSLFADMFLHPAFSESEFKKAKKNQLEKILALQSQPFGQLFSLFSDSLPATTPYHLQTEGTSETVNKIRLDDLRRMHRRLLVPRRMIVSVFGDIDTGDAAYTAKGLFAELPGSEETPPISFDRDNQFVRQPDEHRQIDSEIGLGIIAWPSVKVTDRKEYAALTVLEAILGGYGSPGGRLFNALREEGLVYRLGVRQMTGPAPGYFYVSFESAPEKIGLIFSRIEDGVEQIKGGDLAEDELARVKEGIIAYRPRELETLAAQARQASLDDLFGLGYKYEESFAARIGEVTRDDVIAAAQKYLTRPAKISISGNKTRD